LRRCGRSSIGTKARRAHVAVVLRHLVLEDQVVNEGVPSQLALRRWSLVQFGALVHEDHVGRVVGVQLLEEVLDPLALVGEEAVRRTTTSLLGTPSTSASALRRAFPARSPCPR
jgi:hypothetical protein